MSIAQAVSTLVGQFEDLGHEINALPEVKFLAVLKQLSSFAEVTEIVGVMEEVRPRLRELRPARPLQLKRLLCQPFEDLLYTGEAVQCKKKLPRSAIALCWSLLMQRDGPKLESFDRELKAFSPTDLEGVFSLGLRLWRHAAVILPKVLDETSAADADAVHIPIMRAILAAAEHIQKFKQVFAAYPLMRISSRESAVITDVVERLEGQDAAIEGYFAAIVARFDRPSDLIQILNKQENRLSAGLLTGLAEVARADVDERLSRLQSREETASPEVLMKNAEGLLNALAATQSVLEGQDRVSLDRQAKEITSEIRDILSSNVVAPAQSLIERVLPTAGTRKEIGREDILAAESQARAIGRARRIAGQLGLEADIYRTIKSVQNKAENEISTIVSNVREAGADVEAAEASLFRSIRLVELMDNRQEAQRLFSAARRQISLAKSLEAEAL